MRLWTILGLSALALSACGQESQPPPASDPTGTSTAPPEPQSIIRPEIEQPRKVALTPLALTISFAAGGAELNAAAKEALREMLRTPQYAAGGPIVLRGHTDSSGSDEANLRASQARAEAVRDLLVEDGVDDERIRIIAFGEQNPVEPNALPDGVPNEAGRQANRRVDITVEIPKKRQADAEPPAAPSVPADKLEEE